MTPSGRRHAHGLAAVDVHAHYVSPRCDALFRRPIGEDTEGLVHDTGAFLSDPSTDLEKRVAWMRRAGIDLQILAPELRFLTRFLGSEEEVVCARLVNDSVAADIGERKEFAALALLAMANGESAARELERAVVELGLSGGLMHSRPPGGMSAGHLEALWRAAASLDVPLMLHSLASSNDERLKGFALDTRMGRSHDVGLAAAELVFGGVMDRHPDLKIVLATGGGSLPFLIARLDRDHLLRPESRSSDCYPSSYMKRFYFDSLLYGRDQLSLLLECAGSDRLMIGSDWPIPLFEEDPIGFVRDACRQRLSDREMSDVIGATAATLFSL